VGLGGLPEVVELLDGTEWVALLELDDFVVGTYDSLVEVVDLVVGT
jgi:hypothetical protein